MKKRIALIILGVVGWCAVAFAGALDEARKYFDQGDYKAAIIEAKNALQQNPSDQAARRLLGEAYLALYKGADAEKEFLRLRQLGAAPDEWMVGLARAYYYQGKNQELVDSLPLDERLSPQAYAQLAALRADAYLALENQEAARAEIEKGRARRADEPALRLSEARLRLAEGKTAEARKLLEALVREVPDYAEAHALLGATVKAQGDNDKAREEFQTAIRLDPNNLSARIGLTTLAIARKDYDEAKKQLAKVLELVPNHLFATYLSGLVDLQEGRLEDAEKKIDYVLQVLPDYQPALLVKGAILLNEKKFEQADRYLTLYIQSHPDNTQVAEWLAYARNRTGDFQGALKVLDRFGNADRRASGQVLRGIALMGLKRFDEASKAFEKALELAPGSTIAERELALARLNLGDPSVAESLFKERKEMGELLFIVKMRERAYDEAEKIARELIAQKADNPVYHNMLGLALLGKGQPKAAIRAFEAAVKADPEYTTARFNLARAYDLLGDLDEAARQYEAVIKIKPTPSAYVGLANVARKRGDEAAAERYLKQAVELNPGAVVYLARFYLDAGRAEEAVKALEGHDQPAALRLKVDALVRLGKLDEAVATARKLPEGPAKHALLARLALAQGDRGEAEKALERALKAKADYLPALLASTRLAIAAQDEKRYRERLARIRKIEGTEDLVTELEGDWALAAGRPKAAMAKYERLIDQGKVSPTLWRKYDASAAQAKALERAAEHYAVYLKKHPDDVQTRRRYAILLQHRGDEDAAAEQYRKVLAASDDLVAMNNLAWIYIERDDPRGLELAAKAYEKNPGNPGVADTYAWALIRSGKVDKGVNILKSILPKLPSGRQANEMKYHLAYGLALAGDLPTAQRYLDELREAGEDDFAQRLEAVMASR